jgi:hypothetical protein
VWRENKSNKKTASWIFNIIFVSIQSRLMHHSNNLFKKAVFSKISGGQSYKSAGMVLGREKTMTVNNIESKLTSHWTYTIAGAIRAAFGLVWDWMLILNGSQISIKTTRAPSATSSAANPGDYYPGLISVLT